MQDADPKRDYPYKQSNSFQGFSSVLLQADEVFAGADFDSKLRGLTKIET